MVMQNTVAGFSRGLRYPPLPQPTLQPARIVMQSLRTR
jgi:hypothetical protein